MRVGVAVPLSGTVSRLRQAVAQETKIPAEQVLCCRTRPRPLCPPKRHFNNLLPPQIVLTEMYYDGFHRSFCDDDDDLEIIQESDSIFAFETPELFRPEQIRSKRGGAASITLAAFFLFVPA